MPPGEGIESTAACGLQRPTDDRATRAGHPDPFLICSAVQLPAPTMLLEEGGQDHLGLYAARHAPSRLRKKLVRRRVSSALTPFENCPVRGGTARRAPRGFGSTPPSPTEWSCRLRRQVADPDQVVDGHSEDE